MVVPVGPSGSYDIWSGPRGPTGKTARSDGGWKIVPAPEQSSEPGGHPITGDGYTLLVGGLSNIVFNVGLYKKPPYDPLKDLVPVALVFNISSLIEPRRRRGAWPGEGILAAKEIRQELTFATIGVGGGGVVGAAWGEIDGNAVAGRSTLHRDPGFGLSRRSVAGRVDLFFEFHAGRR